MGLIRVCEIFAVVSSSKSPVRYCVSISITAILLKFPPPRYASDGHLLKEWMESTREISDISSAAVRAATYVSKLKVGQYCNLDNFVACSLESSI